MGLHPLVKIYVGHKKDLTIGGLKTQFPILSWHLMGKLFFLWVSLSSMSRGGWRTFRVSRTQYRHLILWCLSLLHFADTAFFTN